jgi:hypothetical protein
MLPPLVSTAYKQNISYVRLVRFASANLLQQLGESFQARSGHVAELAFVKLANRLIETFQERETRGCDAGFDDTAVGGLASAGDETAFFHAVEEASHVGVVRNHTFTDAAAGEAKGLSAAKNAENVVLSAREAMRLEKLDGLEAEGVGGFLEGNKEAIFEGEIGWGRVAATHEDTIVVTTTNVKRKSLRAARRRQGLRSGRS